jgi:hypothetical protein
VKSLGKWTLRWLERAKRAPVVGPFDHDPDFRLLVGPVLLHAARRFQNCLPQQLGEVALGRKVFYEWLPGPGAIVELYCLSDGSGRSHFHAGQIRGVSNARLPPGTLNAIRSRLSAAGVLFRGANIGQRAPVFALVDVFDDEDADHAFASFLDELEFLSGGEVMRLT